jgi:ATP-dependent DNA helicase RecQ
VVVSPLIALQRDQVQALLANEVTAAEANSHVGAGARRKAFDDLVAGDLEFLFLAPEQLANPEVLAETVAAQPSLLVVDEAHCISSWGHDFRPDYLRLGAFAAALGRPPILALTATASPPVRTEVVERLGLVDPAIVVRGFDRPEIGLSVRRFTDGDAKRAAVLDSVAGAEGLGIVYVATRRTAREVAQALAARGVRAEAYHAGLARKARREVEAAFAGDDLQVVVATTAFGMGIDNANVRYVFHHDVADSLDAYYQEIGRCGRDGEPAEAVLFYRPEDLGLRRFFASGTGPHPDDVAAVAEGSGSGEENGLSRSRLTSAQAFLEEIGDVDDPAEAAALAAAARESRQKVQESRVEMMRAYAEARGCRRQVLLGYFGEPLDLPCGNCDRCEAGAADGSADASHPFDVHSRVTHGAWGSGQVLGYEGSTMTVYFESVGYKTLDVDLVREGDLLTPEVSEPRRTG